MTESHPPNKQTPCEMITTLRKHGWNQVQIAAELRTTQPTVSRIWSGHHRNPGYMYVERLRELVSQLNDFTKV